MVGFFNQYFFIRVETGRSAAFVTGIRAVCSSDYNGDVIFFGIVRRRLSVKMVYTTSFLNLEFFTSVVCFAFDCG